MTTGAETLRTALLEQAHAECVAVLARADAQAAAIRADADARGHALVEQAQAEGAAAAAIGGAHDEARARRAARALVLAAERSLYDELCGRARASAQALRGTGEYAALLRRLQAQALTQLGEDAVVEVDPAGAGGVRARSGGRSVDYTLDAIVERCIAGLGSEVERLWR